MPTPRPARSLRTASRFSTTSWTPFADHRGAGRAGWRHLHHPHVLAGSYIVVEAEADLPRVEVLRGVDVADRDGYDFELHVHDAPFLCARQGTSPTRLPANGN